MKTQKMTKSDW